MSLAKADNQRPSASALDGVQTPSVLDRVQTPSVLDGVQTPSVLDGVQTPTTWVVTPVLIMAPGSLAAPIHNQPILVRQHTCKVLMISRKQPAGACMEALVEVPWCTPAVEGTLKEHCAD